MYFRRVFRCAAVLLVAVLGGWADDLLTVPPTISSSSVSKYSVEPLAQLGSLNLPVSPRQVIPNLTASKYYFVSRSTADTVVVVDSAFQNVVKRLSFGSFGEAAELTPDGRYLLVLAGGVRVIDTATDELVATIAAGTSANDLAISKDSRRAYILSASTNRLTEVDLTTMAPTNRLLQFPATDLVFNVSISPHEMLFVGASNRLFRVNPQSFSIVDQSSSSGRPGKMQFNREGTRGYAPNRSGRSIFVYRISPEFRLETNLGDMGATVDAIAVASDSVVYAHSPINFTVWRVDPNAQTAAPAGFVSAPVLGMTISREVTSARHLFLVTAQTLYRVNPISQTVTGQAPPPPTPGPLTYATAAVTAIPTQAIPYNANQALGNGETGLPFVVRVTDESGTPLYNVPTQWTSDDGRVTLNNSMTATNKDGYSMTRPVAPTSAGVYPVRVMIGVGTGLTAQFTINVGSQGGGGGGGGGGGDPGSGGLFRVSGNGQVVLENFPTLDPMVVRLLDDEGNPRTGVRITWNVTPPGAGGVLPLNITTNAEGIARANFVGVASVGFSRSVMPATVTASGGGGSVTFAMTTAMATLPTGGLAPAPLVELLAPGADRRITGRAGTVIDNAIRVRVTINAGSEQGLPLAGVGIALINASNPNIPAAGSCRGGEPLSDASGVASCDLEVGGNVGTNLLTIRVGGYADFTGARLVIDPSPPSTITIVSGDGQIGAPGATLPQPLFARVTDAFGNAFPGTQVVWEVISGSATLFDTTTVTDANSRVSTRVTLGPATGAVQVRARVPDGPSVIFNLQSVAALGELRRVSGDGQTADTGQPFGQPLLVQVLDTQGQPVPNINVSFAVTQGAGTLSTVASTNAQGFTSVIATAGNNPGTMVVTASVGNFSTTFTLTITAPRPPGPAITAASFVSGAGFHRGISPGAITTIIGAGLAPNIQNCVVANTIVGRLPIILADVTVRFGTDGWAPIFAVCNVNGQQQVTFQAPFELQPGTTAVTVSVGPGFTTIEDLEVRTVHPGIFESVGSTGLLQAVALRPDGSLVDQLNPAQRGEEITLFVTGLGQTSPMAFTGRPGVDGQSVNAAIVVGVNNAGVPVIGAEYAENLIGVYKVRFLVPAEAPSGEAIRLAIAVQDGDSLRFGNPSTLPIQ